jgi:hypothetical protein
MTKTFVLGVVFALGTAGAALAADKKAPAAAKPGDKITGEVVDITCYASHEAKGEKHGSCAQKCLSAGMPAGIVADGKLWVVTTSDHTPPGNKLAALAGKMVTATGHKVEKDGAMVFEMDTVEASK